VKIGFYQFSPRYGEVEYNRQTIVQAVRESDADLLVIPELATSGYFFPDTEDMRRMAEPADGPTTEAIAEAAGESDCTVVYGLAEKLKGRYYNSAVLVNGNGVAGVYRKVHLFNEETIHFTPGEEDFPLFEVQGVKVGLLVCFDHMYPEAARTLALAGAQIICHPSNLVLPEYGQLTSRVRALENRVFWILSNRWGTETAHGKSLEFTGVSQVVDSRGKVLIQAEPAADELSAVDIDPAQALDKQLNPYNSLMEDRRPEFYFPGE
jgi:predicted amidohydrolase